MGTRSASEGAGNDEENATTPLSRVIVMDQPLPAPLTVERVEVRRITMAPGVAAGLHVHNGPVFGSVEAGSVVFQVEGEPETVLGPGDVFYEPEGVRVARFDAQGEGAVFLGYFPLEAGQPSAIEFPPD